MSKQHRINLLKKVIREENLHLAKLNYIIFICIS